VAKDINCSDASASISRVKHVLDSQDVGDLELNEPPLVIIYRHFHAGVGATVGMLASFPHLISHHTFNLG